MSQKCHTKMSLYIIVNDGINHPSAAPDGAKLGSTHGEREYLFDCVKLKGSSGDIHIRRNVNGRQRVGAIRAEQDIVRRSDDDTFEAFELAQVHCASEEAMRQCPDVQVCKHVQRIDAVILLWPRARVGLQRAQQRVQRLLGRELRV